MMLTTQNICVHCGKEKKENVFNLCPECCPFIYKKGQSPHQKIRQTKKWKEHRLQRLNKSNNKCDWCEKEDKLVVHHLDGITYRYYEQTWNECLENKLNYLIKNDLKWKNEWEDAWSEKSKEKLKKQIISDYIKKHPEKKVKSVKACPYCDSSSLNERKTTSPKYYCSNCKKKFNKAKIRYSKELTKKIYKQINWKLKEIFNNKIIVASYEELLSLYHEKINSRIQEYLSMNKTLVLCKKCHYAIEQNMKLCPKCKTNYCSFAYDKCYACQEKDFVAEHGAHYVIEKIDKNFIIRSLPDRKLSEILRYTFDRRWDEKLKVWILEDHTFYSSQKELMDYIISTGKSYDFKFISPKIRKEVAENIKIKNYREKIKAQLPPCAEEFDGYCNDAGDYVYGGSAIKCHKETCDSYFPEHVDFDKLSEIWTKLHLIDQNKKPKSSSLSGDSFSQEK